MKKKYDEYALELLLEADRKAREMKDNYDLYVEHEMEEQEWLESRPICSECGEHIQDEYAYKIGGRLICKCCMESYSVAVEEEC